MKRRSWWRGVVLASGLILAVLGQRMLFQQREDRVLPVILMLVAGTIILQLSQARSKGQLYPLEHGAREEQPKAKGERRRLPWLVEGVGTVVALLLTLEVAVATHQPASNYYGQALLWLLAMGSYASLFTQGDEGTQLRALWRVHRGELLLVSGIATLALSLRLVGLNHIPWPLAEDEGAFGTQALEVLDGQRRNPFLTGYLAHPNLFSFLQAAGLKLLGIGPAGLRLPSALAGALLVVPVYALGRQWFGRWVGLVAAVLMATFHFPLHYSRVGLNNIIDPLLAATALAFLTWGFRSGRRLAFALTGLTLGLSQYFYSSSWLALPLVAIYGLLAWRRPSHEIEKRPQLTGTHTLILLAGFLVAFGPLLWTFLQTPDLYMDATRRGDIFRSGWLSQTQAATGRSTLNLLADQVAHAALAFNYYQDRTVSRLYNPSVPLLDAASGTLWLFGLVVALHRRREAGAATLLVWVAGVILFGGALLQNPPASSRMLFITPALALLVALGLRVLIEAMARLWPKLTSFVPSLLTSGCMVLAITNLAFYFGVYTPRQLYGTRNDEIATHVGQYLAAHRGEGIIYFAGLPGLEFDHPTIRFLGQNPPGQDLPESTDPSALQRDKDTTFVFLPGRERELLSFALSGWQIQEFYSVKENNLSFVVYTLAAEQSP